MKFLFDTTMLACSLKMRTFFKFLVCIIIVSGKMNTVDSAMQTSVDTVLKYSKCIIDNMSESDFFTAEDRDIMIDIQEIMAQSLSFKSKKPISAKILVGTLITSLADLMITDNAVKNNYRKGIYTLALQKCSSLSNGYMDINEAHRILFTIEKNKAPKYQTPGVSSGVNIPATGDFKSIAFSTTSGVNNPPRIPPYPMQNPSILQNGNSNDRTIFKQQEKPYIPPLSLTNAQYKTQTEKQLNLFPQFGASMQRNPGNFVQKFDQPNISKTGEFYPDYTPNVGQKNFVSSSTVSELLQPKKEFINSQSKEISSDYDIDMISEVGRDKSTIPSYTEPSQIDLKNKDHTLQTTIGGLSVPQTKESSVIVISPPNNKPILSDKKSPLIIQQENEEGLDTQSNQELSEIDYDKLDKKQTDFDFQSPPLAPEYRKSEIFSLALARYLSNSETIGNFFCGETDLEDKVQISYSIIKASLVEYGQHVKTLAASVASGALSELSEEELCYNYAETISESVSEILERNRIDDADPESISRKMEIDLNQRQVATISDNFPTRVSEAKSYTTVPQVESSFESAKEISSNYQGKTEYPNQVTTSDNKDTFDVKYTDPITLPDESDCLSTEQTTEDSDTISDDTLVQKSFANYLTGIFDHVFRSSDSNYEETYEENNSSAEKIKKQENLDYEFSKDKIYSDSKTSNAKISSVELQPSFKGPINNSEDSNAKFKSNYSIEFVEKLSEIAKSSITHIRSPNFNLINLCSQINQFAKLVNIPRLDKCEPIAAIDYLLNVLTATVTILK